MSNRITEQPFCQTRFSCRFIGGFQDTRTNKEDFALTPYLFSVWVTGEIIKVRGVGICWGYYSVYLGLGWDIPKNYPSFKVFSKNGNVLRLGEGCLTKSSRFAQNLMAAFAKPLFCAGRFISTKFNFKTK